MPLALRSVCPGQSNPSVKLWTGTDKGFLGIKTTPQFCYLLYPQPSLS